MYGSIDYNIVHNSDGMGYDEVNNKYRIKLQIKSNTGDVPIGFFNLRIIYNNNCLAYNIGESYSIGPIEDFTAFGLFDIYDLIPMETTSVQCGFSGVYSGLINGPELCYYIGDSWTDCGVLIFDVIDGNQNMDIHWDQGSAQNQVTLYDGSPVLNGNFLGDHDWIISDYFIVPEPFGNLYFTEVTSSPSGIGYSPYTGYLELFNASFNYIDLSGLVITKGNRNHYSFNLSGQIEPFGCLLISSGADETQFFQAWSAYGLNPQTPFLQGENALNIGGGHRYYLENVYEERLDSTAPLSWYEIYYRKTTFGWLPDDDYTPGTFSIIDPMLWELPVQGDLQFGEINARDYGFDPSVSYIVIKNTGCMKKRLKNCILQRTNTCSYKLPLFEVLDWVYLDAGEELIITNGASREEFMQSWGDGFPGQFLQGDPQLGIGGGNTYELIIYESNIDAIQTPVMTEDDRIPDLVAENLDDPETDSELTDVKDGVENHELVTKLLGNHPNPFNPETAIEFSLKGKSGDPVDVELVVYNIKGQKIATLINQKLNPSELHTVNWNGRDSQGNSVSSGVYFYRIITPDYSETSKMVLMK